AGPDVVLGVAGTDLGDTATLTGVTAGAGGAITFHVYSDATCTKEDAGSPVTKTVSGDRVYTSPALPAHAAATYHRAPNYTGDDDNGATANGCNEANENVTVNPRTPTVTTNAGPILVLAAGGNDLADSATLAGATATAGGTITFHLYSDATCTKE